MLPLPNSTEHQAYRWLRRARSLTLIFLNTAGPDRSKTALHHLTSIVVNSQMNTVHCRIEKNDEVSLHLWWTFANLHEFSEESTFHIISESHGCCVFNRHRYLHISYQHLWWYKDAFIIMSLVSCTSRHDYRWMRTFSRTTHGCRYGETMEDSNWKAGKIISR